MAPSIAHRQDALIEALQSTRALTDPVFDAFVRTRVPRLALFATLTSYGDEFVHLPAAMWAAWVEVTATICPLTPLENALRRRAGEAGYPGGFVEHYVLPLLYPAGLTPGVQAWLGAFVVALNAVIYAFAILRWRRSRH